MRFPGLVLALAMAGCGSQTATLEDLHTRIVRLPGGELIRAEVMTNPADMARGMMFRDELPRGRGMLFIHQTAGTYTYWMYQVKIPLDIIWMDSDRRIVEISANTPPCDGKPRTECPSYGGNARSQYVLELAGGEAARLGLKVGGVLTF
jgi:uncharacterized membrane protein (UPF0127 family)